MHEMLVGKRPRSILDLMREEPPPQPCWIAPAMLPKRAKMLLGGEAKLGKSYMCLEIARALATASSPFGYDKFVVPEPVKVLYVEQELGEYGLRLRAKKALRGEDENMLESRLLYVSRDPGIVLSSEAGREHLMGLIETVQPGVVILDPIGKMHFYDENDATKIARLFNFFDQLLERFASLDLSIIIVHHFRKPPANTLQKQGYDALSPYNFSGSRKWYDDPDTLITGTKMLYKPVPWQAYEVRLRFEFRHGSSPPDIIVSVNREPGPDGEGDGRVRFEKTVGNGGLKSLRGVTEPTDRPARGKVGAFEVPGELEF